MKTLAFLFYILLPVSLFAEVESEKEKFAEVIKKNAEICAQAQLELDFEKFIPYVPEKLLGFMGGKEGLENTIKQGTEEMKRRGITMDKVKIGKPDEPKKYGRLLAGLVPQELTLTTPQGKLVTKSHFIAISEDKGENWVFLDCATINDAKLGILYPSLKGKINIPATETKLSE